MLGYGAGVPFGCEGRAGTWNWQYDVAISDVEKTGEEGQKVHFWAHYAKERGRQSQSENAEWEDGQGQVQG